jgi:rhamnosyl/mannosyltransferase
MRRHKADVWVLHFPCPTAEIGYLLSRPKGALVVRYQSDIVRQANALRVYKPVLMQFLRKADMILPTSRQYVESSPFLSAFSEKCRVVPLGIDVDAFALTDAEAAASLRRTYGERFVFFCGRHRYYKGLRYLVEAAPHIRGQVVIAGDGPERTALERQAAELGISIVFIGALSNESLVQHLHAASVVAFPSIARSEAYGIGMLEAHACGTPVVATRLGTGVEFVNEDGVTGLNVPPADAKALAEAVNRLLDDEALRQTMGNAARERVRRQFDARDIARREWGLYQEACA